MKNVKPKSASQRLRQVIEVFWEHAANIGLNVPENKEDFYQGEMEKIITIYKSKIPHN